MDCKVLKEIILNLCKEHIKEANDGYNKIHSDYWFGRLCESEDIEKQVKIILNTYRVEE